MRTLSTEDLEYAQEHCRILCGMYGAVELLSDITYYDHYEIRITMRREHSAALKYTTAGQRPKPTIVEPYKGLGGLKQRKQVSRESILTQISLKSSIRSYGTKHTRILPRPANFLQQLLVT